MLRRLQSRGSGGRTGGRHRTAGEFESGSTLMPVSRRRPMWMAGLVAATTVLGGVSLPAAFGSSVTSAVFTGGAGTASVGGTLYAKQGGALTLTVVTSSDTKCVEVTGAFTGRQTSNTAKSTWTFTPTA